MEERLCGRVIDIQVLCREMPSGVAHEVEYVPAGRAEGLEKEGPHGNTKAGVRQARRPAIRLEAVVSRVLKLLSSVGSVEGPVGRVRGTSRVRDHDVVSCDGAIMIRRDDIWCFLFHADARDTRAANRHRAGREHIRALVCSSESGGTEVEHDLACYIVVTFDAPAAPAALATQMVTKDIPIRSLTTGGSWFC